MRAMLQSQGIFVHRSSKLRIHDRNSFRVTACLCATSERKDFVRIFANQISPAPPLNELKHFSELRIHRIRMLPLFCLAGFESGRFEYGPSRTGYDDRPTRGRRKTGGAKQIYRGAFTPNTPRRPQSFS
jgi:hypothetical protein